MERRMNGEKWKSFMWVNGLLDSRNELQRQEVVIKEILKTDIMELIQLLQ